ncbi:hypothetical protein QBC34DRAFT_290287 [Podospora aff. communis PSN243]|uniref:Microbial-type PARG catalytic domain-containing protein n=1 Tax=Podospora aff. communis PSN243 TaxID=3040156 RepID=A0AAV9GZ35_9PEZI|nr:hypothetical protein QBC34DRAFT_290287 [Podospora aff. communis PSN243]
MGRTQPSRGLAPAATRKDARAKKAKATINKTIPSLLSAHPRARDGIAASELITPEALTSLTAPKTNPSNTNATIRITLRVCDTLTAAHSLLSHYTPHTSHTTNPPSPTTPESTTPNPPDLTNRRSRTCILNMASPLSPGGGFLSGATSQEESLCMRTTLLPSLRDEFYRLPELSCVYTPDVLVFRDEDGEDLKKGERWFVDVVTCAALRGPEVEGGRYVSGKDREAMRDKMRLVMGVCRKKGAKRVILGAWGCGAYGNPVGEVAEGWRGVLGEEKGAAKGDARESREWEGIEEVVFAIKDRGMAERFASAFGEGLVWEEEDVKGAEEEEEDGDVKTIKELAERIREMELQAEQARSPQLKIGLERAIVGLREQLRGEQQRSTAGRAEEDTEEDAESGDDDSSGAC